MTKTLSLRKSESEIVVPDLSQLSIEQLEAEFSSALKDTADGLLRLAAAVTELERRGRDMSHLKLNLISYLRMIAARQLLPDVVLYLGDQKAKVQAIADLPLSRQRALLEENEVPVLVNGEEHKVPLRELDRRHIPQVFGEGRVRTFAEQRAFVRQKRTAKAPKEVAKRNVQAVPDRHGIKIGNSFATVSEVVATLAELSGPLEELNIDKDHESATVRLTAKEKQKLKAAEKRRGLPEWHLIREALRAYGLI